MKNGISINGYTEWIYSSPFYMGEKEEPHISHCLGLLQKTDTLSVEQKLESFFKNSYLFAFLKIFIER